MINQSSVAWKVLEGDGKKIGLGLFPSIFIGHEYVTKDELLDSIRSATLDKYDVSNGFLGYFDLAKEEIKKSISKSLSSSTKASRAFFTGKNLLVVEKGVHEDENKFEIWVFTPPKKSKHSFDLLYWGTGRINGNDFDWWWKEEYEEKDEYFHGPFLEQEGIPEALDALALYAFMDIGEVFEEEVNLPAKRQGSQRKAKPVKSDWKLLNSSYLKTSIRTEGFAVSGHFRLQPCGPGRSKVKLIFISPYEKNGYIRTAEKDKK